MAESTDLETRAPGEARLMQQRLDLQGHDTYRCLQEGEVVSIESIRSQLIAIERAHREVNDGGYSLTSALCSYRAQLPEHAANEWDQVLVGWVRDRSARFWGVALEALARVGGPDAVDELVALLQEQGRDDQWREYVTNALIRRGFSSGWLVVEVIDAARRATPMGLQNLAALMAVVPGLLQSAATCIISALSAWKHEYVEGLIAPFVNVAADTDPEMLVRLVQKVEEDDQESGERLAEILRCYLQRPFVQARFPPGIALRIATKLGSGA